MNTRERRRALLSALQRDKRVVVAELAERFDVTTMTVRRDLRRLAETNVVTLVHGGAIYNEGGASLPTVTARAQVMQAAKVRLATYAASLVQEGNAIYLDTGSTCMAIAQVLAERKNIAVLTHSLGVMNILASASGIQLFTMAGQYREDLKGFFGDLTCRDIDGFRIDLAFLGTCALSLSGGVMSTDIADQGVKRKVLETTRRSVAVVDHTKIGKSAFLRVCGLHDLDTIITDKDADDTFVAGARKQGVEVVQV
ncbi:MAG: DeoR/GlpR family DNA-binding transcription regulator [Selenomonas sp.]|nr:DeoR/GlpR family DNA-binding transcription regulator [Selenomonas sp.]